MNSSYSPVIKLTFPSTITLPGTCSLLATTNILGTATCAVSGQVITLTGITSTTYAGGNLIAFKINGFTNAPSSGGAGVSLIETYLRDTTNTDYLVD